MIAAHPNDRFKDLASTRQRMVRLMQDIHFGQITFHIRRSEPDVERPWRTRRTIKLAGGPTGPRPQAMRADFALCREQTAFLATLARLRDGACVTVEVRHGLPFLVEIEQEHPTA